MEGENMKVSGYANYMQNNVHTLVKQTPDMQTKKLKPECALVTDRLELSSEGISQGDTLKAPDHISIKIPREWTIGGERVKNRVNLGRT